MGALIALWTIGLQESVIQWRRTQLRRLSLVRLSAAEAQLTLLAARLKTYEEHYQCISRLRLHLYNEWPASSTAVTLGRVIVCLRSAVPTIFQDWIHSPIADFIMLHSPPETPYLRQFSKPLGSFQILAQNFSVQPDLLPLTRLLPGPLKLQPYGTLQI